MAHLPQLTDAQFEDVIEQLGTLLRLDPNTIEFDDIRAALVSTLAKRESLAGYLEADTIVFLVDAIAAIGVYTQYSIDAAWAEGNLHTALGDASIRAIIRTLGVRQRRKIPAQMTALFTHSGDVNLNAPLDSQTIPAYSTFVVSGNNFFNRQPISFFKRKDFVFHADNTNPWGIWGDGTTIWISDPTASKLFAYNASTGEYTSSKDITLDTANADARGIWGDGTTIWVVNADGTSSKLFAYTISTGAHDSTKDKDLHDNNDEPRGVTQGDDTWWISDADGTAYGYMVETGTGMTRDSDKDLDLTEISPATTGLWVNTDTDYLYTVSHTRCAHVFDVSGEDLDEHDNNLSEKEFNLVDQNSSPRDIWSNGTTLWIVDAERAYSYNLETGVRGEQEAREKTVTLYQGTIRELELDVGAEAQDYARFVSEEKNFQIADEDVRVALNDQALDVVHDPLWRYRNRNTASGSHQVNNVVQDFTLSDGSLELRFGTRNFGRRLTAGAKLNIAYVLTDGAGAHNYNVNGESVLLPEPLPGKTYDHISATITSVLRNGFNELDVDAYRTVGPLAFAAQHVAIDFAGYRAAALEYPGMIDCLPIRQAHYAPNVLQYTNMIKISLLADDPNRIVSEVLNADETSGTKQYPITDEYWKRFDSFLTARGISSVKYLRNDPVAREVKLKAKVYTQITANEALVHEAVENALKKLFEPRPGILGLTIQRSDIITAIMRAASGILYVELLNPTEEAIHSQTQAVAISEKGGVTADDSTSNGGSLAAGTYAYKYTIRTQKEIVGGQVSGAQQYEIGESLPFTISYDGETEWTLDNVGKITINFNKPPFGHDVRLYRITSGTGGAADTIKLLGASSTEGSTTQGWTENSDTGSLKFVDSNTSTGSAVTKIPAARTAVSADIAANTIAVPGTPEGFDSTHVFYPQLVLTEGAIQIIATNPAIANSVS